MVWQYNYVLRDHLGNTRVTFADTTGNGLIDPTIEIAQINHFYPYGLNMDGNWNGASLNVKNKYQYNDKELQTDFGLNLNDYGARFYDPAIGRFTTADPMADFRSWVSPYQYVQNNPINRIDPTGMLDGKGADGMTNEQWMKASNPANNGSQAASTAYSGLNHAKTNYENQKTENEYAAAHGGATRPVTGDDIAASSDGAKIIWEGYRTNAKNTVDGFHFECNCGGKGQPPCKGVTYRYNRKNPSDYGARWPDFYNFNVSAGTWIGWNGTLSVDRHWQIYFSYQGGTLGKSATTVAFSGTASWLRQNSKPTSNQMYNFLSGHGVNTTAGFILGGSFSQSPTNKGTQEATGFGLVSPQIGISYNYTFDNLIWR